MAGFTPDSSKADLASLTEYTIQPWLEQCCDKHDKCQQLCVDFQATLPTRLIDVGALHSSAVTLFETKHQGNTIKDPRYLTLSYCWGKGNEEAKTTSSNISLRKEKDGIFVRDLPTTIQHAIFVTRSMGVRYLWVDAVCIIQHSDRGDLGDWQHESLKLSEHYANALCYISASHTSDSSRGFLMERQLIRYQWLQHTIPHYESRGETTGTFSILPPKLQLGDELRENPLMNRGWCFQEWMFSKRILHWTRIGVFWECREAMHFEATCLQPLAAGDGSLAQSSRHCPEEFCDSLDTFQEDTSILQWYNLVEKYSAMGLTYASDRLVAIHSLASYLATKYQQGYFAGLFSMNLWYGLLWTGDGERSTCFPTWSWASMSRVSFKQENFREASSLVTRASEKDVHPIDHPTGFHEPSSRILQLNAPLVSLVGCLVIERADGSWHVTTTWPSNIGKSYNMRLDANTLEIPDTNEILFLALARVKHGSLEGSAVRRLESLVGEQIVYERVGTIEQTRAEGPDIRIDGWRSTVRLV